MALETGLERLKIFPTFQVNFEIMGIALSSLQIGKLDLKNLPSRPYKGLRLLPRQVKLKWGRDVIDVIFVVRLFLLT